jgi:DNA-binding NarL/FixJ family response regulator
MSIAVSPPIPVLRDPSPEEVRVRLAHGPVVVVGTSPSLVSTLLSTRAAHGWALLPPDASAEAIASAMRAAGTGMVLLPVWVARHFAPPAPPDSLEAPLADDEAVERLTAREHDVLQHVAQGLHNRDIASALGISDHTVKFHLASIFGKLGASTRTEAVRVGLRRGLVQI